MPSVRARILSGLIFAISLFNACSRLQPLTRETLGSAETQWKTSQPSGYDLTIEIEGDRVEKSEYQVVVENGVMTTLKRNGQAVTIVSGQDYSMSGLFKTLSEEMDLAENPVSLGAEEGYSAYLMARFDSATGRLIEYRRSVGGISNSIHIQVVSFSPS